MYLEKDIRVYIYSKRKVTKRAPPFSLAITLIYIYERVSKIYELSKSLFLSWRGGARVDIFHSNAKSRVEKYELREYRCCILAITTSLEDVLQGRKSYRRGGEKREIRGKGKDGGTNKVHRGGGGATRGGK